jgi:peptide/nickel transport system permease protein
MPRSIRGSGTDPMLDQIVPPNLSASSIARPQRWQTVVRRLRRRPGTIVGLAGIILVLVAAILGPVLWTLDPTAQHLSQSLRPPVWEARGLAEHPLGTDALGRDILSRLLHGARNSLTISAAAVLLGSTLGLAIGLLAGFLGGRVDALLMRLGDIQLAFPFVLLAIAFLGTTPERGVVHLILVLGIPSWIIYARVVRSRVLAEKEKDYVLAARSIGASSRRRMVRYILPNVWQVVPVIAMLDLGFLVIVESMLSFLGIGLTPPTPSWGSILADGRQFMIVVPWMPILPGLAILLTVLSINLTADGLADTLDPKLTRGAFRRVALKALTGPPKDRIPEMLLQVHDLATEFRFDDRLVRPVRGVTFDVPRGRTLGIVGESGSGKSVTAMSIIQLLESPGRVTGGEILFDGRDLNRVSDSEMRTIRGRRIGMIFQNPTASLNPVLSIGTQFTETIRRHRVSDPTEAAAMAGAALISVGIGDPERVLRAYPFQLSGGMNQRVMIAMAMVLQPDLLIADEPTTALDVTTQAQILDRLGDLREQAGTSVILITHDIALLSQYAENIVVMYAGRVCEAGPIANVIDDPRHPYTRALLDSIPREDEPAGARLRSIPGDPPDPSSIPPGCPFAARCPAVMPVCREVDPPLIAVANARVAACHLNDTERHPQTEVA